VAWQVILQRSPQANESQIMYLLSPKQLMWEREYAQAVRLLNERDRSLPTLSELFAELTSRKSATLKDKKRRERFDAINRRLEALAEAVLLRELGLKKYMVITLAEVDGGEKRFQAKRFTIFKGFGNRGGLVWELAGRGLLKNDSLGAKIVGTCFVAGKISRRKLNGKWEILRPAKPMPIGS
jgi:hypothetical protein